MANIPYLMTGLESKNPLVRSEAVRALHQLNDFRPKADDAGPYRTLLEAAPQLGSPKDRWLAVQVLRRWNGRTFGAAENKGDAELRLWARWFNQSFPKERPLTHVAGQKPPESKYRLDELLKVLEKEYTYAETDRAP